MDLGFPSSDVNGPYAIAIGPTPSAGAYRFGRMEGVPIVGGCRGDPAYGEGGG